MLPVRIAECEMPLLMMGIKWIDAVSLGIDAAIDALAKALRAPDTSPSASASNKYVEDLLDLTMLGMKLQSQRKYTEALDVYERVLELDPINAATWYLRTDVLHRLGRTADAKAAYQRARELSGEE